VTKDLVAVLKSITISAAVRPELRLCNGPTRSISSSSLNRR